MTSQLSHANFFSDLNKVTLRRVFETDQGWIMEAHGQNSAICPGWRDLTKRKKLYVKSQDTILSVCYGDSKQT
jgi:hypothetical protein